MPQFSENSLANNLFARLICNYSKKLAEKPGKPQSLPWQSSDAIKAYLGPKPSNDRHIGRHNPRKPHGPGNTCWKSQASISLYKAPERPARPRKEKPIPTQREPKIKAVKPVRQFRRDKQEKRKKTRIPPDWTFTCPIDNEQVRLLRVELGIPT
jgi:hypothetical protein